MNYEVGWSWMLRRLGYKGIATYNKFTSAENPTHALWDHLIKLRYPFIKKELVRDNLLRISLENLPNVLNSYTVNWAERF